MDEIPLETWVAAVAHRLQVHWRTIDPLMLEETAHELARDPRLREMPPAEAATRWLEPIEAQPAEGGEGRAGESCVGSSAAVRAASSL